MVIGKTTTYGRLWPSEPAARTDWTRIGGRCSRPRLAPLSQSRKNYMIDFGQPNGAHEVRN